MAIYHLEAKVISRGTGRSACAASAYMSCSAIYNEYDGVQHDYTRKQGLVWEHVFLPDCAPVEWQDRAKLWNAVEEVEKTKEKEHRFQPQACNCYGFHPTLHFRQLFRSVEYHQIWLWYFHNNNRTCVSPLRRGAFLNSSGKIISSENPVFVIYSITTTRDLRRSLWN